MVANTERTKKACIGTLHGGGTSSEPYFSILDRVAIITLPATGLGHDPILYTPGHRGSHMTPRSLALTPRRESRILRSQI